MEQVGKIWQSKTEPASDHSSRGQSGRGRVRANYAGRQYGGDPGPPERGFGRRGPRVPPGPSLAHGQADAWRHLFRSRRSQARYAGNGCPNINPANVERPLRPPFTKLQACQRISTFPSSPARFVVPRVKTKRSDSSRVWTKVDARGHTFDESLALTLQAVLVSPQFLLSVSKNTEALPDEAGDVHLLSEYELASRLSYFLWSRTCPTRNCSSRGRTKTAREPACANSA